MTGGAGAGLAAADLPAPPATAERGGEAWARAAWSIVAEPGDTTAGAVVAALGAPAALAWALWAVTVTPADALRRLRDLVREDAGAGGAAGAGGGEIGASRRDRCVGAPISAGTADLAVGRAPEGALRGGSRPGAGGDEGSGAFEQGTLLGPCVGAAGARGGAGVCDRVGGRDDAGGCSCAGGGCGGAVGDPAGGTHEDAWHAGTLRVLARALPRWAPRLADLDPRPALDDLAGRGGVLLLPGTPAWPRGLDDLGPAAPLCLWLRGDPDLAGAAARSVAVVGARAATAYGERVAGDLGAGLAERGVTVVSGGAFGVDVAAHRGALAAGGRTVALLAGGIDRPSPAGNLAVLERIVDDGGALVAESPPGTPPSRARFLQRNRVIAALTGATVVVEAAWRSGALSTAARAGELLRPVGAVPGPVTSMASVGCHRLLRDGAAVCVTDAAQVVELLDPVGSSARKDGSDAPDPTARRGSPGSSTQPGAPGAGRRLRAPGSPARPGVPDPAARADSPAARADSPAARVLDALDRGRVHTVAEVARRSGLAEREVVAALGLLELAGEVSRAAGRWRRAPAPRASAATG